ncbi:30S ribosomal protein S13 [Candidatus Beckwithbacteria bacterium RBG_13_35_6]|uniref:Small ribosomal subunit protein uS13 n=1 Tax=Candidatus Beckwithbacteria bacterium RBG_13_35_6 TaxID=1797456 RepID=A0A1F5DHB4_9BACT|nr:MAG: 30S ribosomal protein S13 [Candidatus Beckwithbacteria bacterium RBG_13_35_6]
MARLSGIELPENKKIKIALTYIYGVGLETALKVLKNANVNEDKRTKEITDDELSRLQKVISSISTEGVLKKMVSENIKRLKQIGSFRGLRHSAGLPVRGQRTRVNARTKRGKRVTVGALKKEVMQKMGKANNDKEKGK